MQAQAQKIFKHFGEESQRLVAKEEWLELQIALMELAKHDIKQKRGCFEGCDYVYETERKQYIDHCNEELADNVLMRMQLEDRDFEEAYNLETHFRYPQDLLRDYHLYNFHFDKGKVKKTVQEKIDRTMKKYGIEV